MIWRVVILWGLLVLLPTMGKAQGVGPTSPHGLHRMVIPPAEESVPVAPGLTRIGPGVGSRQAISPAAAQARAGMPVGERKAALPPPPPKQELAFAPAAMAAGASASGLAAGGLGFAPLLGLVGIAGVGAAAAVAGGGGGPVATVSTR